MRISHTHRFVFVNSPRAGSHSLHALCDTHWSTFAPTDEHHEVYANCPPEYRDYFSWTVVRDPYERMISVWLYDQRHAKRPLTLTQFVLEWIGHAERVREEGVKSIYRYALPQLDRAAGVDLVLRLEDLPGDLRRLPWLPDVPPKGCTNDADWLPALLRRNSNPGPRIRGVELSLSVRDLIQRYEGDAIWELYER